MKRKVYTDGNGGTRILIDGLGVYVPQPELYELKAQVEKLREDLARCRHQASYTIGGVDALQEQLGRVRLICNMALAATPTQCLAEIKAQAVEDAFNYAREKCKTYFDFDFYVMEYANLLTESSEEQQNES